MKLLISILTLLLFGVLQNIEAQDYIVKANGDTIRGEVKLLSSNLINKAQVKVGKEKQIYTTLEIRTCFVKGEFYCPVIKENVLQWMKLIIDGSLGLYAFKMPNENSYNGRFLVRLGKPSMEVPNILFKKVMADYIEDCPSTAEKIKDETYRKKDIEKIVNEYNLCAKEQKLIAAVAVTTVKQKLEALEILGTKVEALPDFTSKKDALDLITAIAQKVSSKEALPNYLLEGLKNSLIDQPEAKAVLDNALALLK